MTPDISPVFHAPPKFEATRLSAFFHAREVFDRGAFCAECNHLGLFFAEDLSNYKDGGHYVSRKCKCAMARDDEAVLRVSDVPVTYVTATFDNWENTGVLPDEISRNAAVLERLRAIASRIKEARADGLNVWIHGAQGTGKTWLGVSLMRAGIWCCRPVRFVDAFSIMHVAIDDKEGMSDLRDSGILLIDGVERLTKTTRDYAEGVLLDLVQYRCANRHMTIFTASEEWSSLADLNTILKDNTARYELAGGQYVTGVGAKWQ